MRSGFPQPSRLEKRPTDQPVLQALARAAHLPVDGVPHEGLFDLVGDIPAHPLLQDQASAPELAQGVTEGFQRLPTQPDEGAQLGWTPQCRQQLEQLEGGLIEGLEPAAHSLRQPAREGTKLGGRQIGSLIEQRLNEFKGKQGVPPRPVGQPGDERLRGLAPDPLLSQLAQRIASEGPDDKFVQQRFLVEAEEDFVCGVLVGEFAQPRRRDHQDATVREVTGQVGERLPGRGVGQVHVVQEQDDRSISLEVLEEFGESFEEAQSGRLPFGSRTSHPSHTPQQAGEVVKKSSAEPRYLFGMKGPEIPIERFAPEPERSRAAEWVRPSQEGRRRLLLACEKLAGEARLTSARIP